jgi:hypothetical protein
MKVIKNLFSLSLIWFSHTEEIIVETIFKRLNLYSDHSIDCEQQQQQQQQLKPLLNTVFTRFSVYAEPCWLDNWTIT